MAKGAGAEVLLYSFANVSTSLCSWHSCSPKAEVALQQTLQMPHGQEGQWCLWRQSWGSLEWWESQAASAWPSTVLSKPPPVLLHHLEILTTQAPLESLLSLHGDICGFQLRNSGFEPFGGWFLQQLAIRSVSISLIAYEFHSEQHESH